MAAIVAMAIAGDITDLKAAADIHVEVDVLLSRPDIGNGREEQTRSAVRRAPPKPLLELSVGGSAEAC